MPMLVNLEPRSIRLWVLGLALIPLVFLILVMAAFLRLGADAQSASAWAAHSDEVLGQLRRLQTASAAAQLAGRRYLLTGSPGALSEYYRAAASVPANAARLRALVADNPSQSRLAADLAAFSVRQIRDTNELMALLRRGNRRAVYEEQVAKALQNPRYGQAADKIPGELARFERSEERLRAARRAESLRLWSWLRDAMLATMLGGVFIALAIGLTLSRRIVVRLRALRDQATAFATSGEVRAPIAGEDEIAEVSRTVHGMANAVRERSDALERYRLLAEMSHEAIIFMRRSDARILQANRAAVDLYGYSPEELLQLTGYDLRTPAAAALADEQMPRQDPFSLRFETEHKRKDGTAFPVEVSAQSAYLNGEHIVLSVIRDVSEQREAEEATKAALRQATEASRLKSEFVATMSHEIRTPLNGVLGMTELLLDSDLDPEQRQFAETARDSAHSLLGVINNILDFSKIEAGRVESEITEFDLVALVESVASMLGRQAHKKNISLMTYVDPLIPPRLFGDALRLRQVLVNLAGNAVKFTGEGGVALLVDPLAFGNDRVRLRFSVRDTGIGIPAQALRRIFEAFHQADGSMTRRYGGTGLGLAISKRLVEIMGGELQVESQEQHGSTFFFHLDLRPAAPVDASRRDALGSLRAIIVDDDVMARDILSRYANSWGLRTCVAQSADAAFTMMREAARRGEAFTVGIIDLRLPHIDGIELARRIRAEPAIAGTTLLLITAFDAPDQGRDAIRAGFSAYLTKPVRQSQLYDAIAEAVLGTRHDAAAAGHPQPVALHAERILLVEDNEVNRRVMLRQLERLGYSAKSACDGQEAIGRVAREAYDLVFMDCQMPVMDGLQATREIRKMESRTGKHVPIVAMTANAMAGDREACLAAGMDDYLSKPVALNDVSRILQHWLAPGRGGDAARTRDIDRP